MSGVLVNLVDLSDDPEDASFLRYLALNALNVTVSEDPLDPGLSFSCTLFAARCWGLVSCGLTEPILHLK